MKFTDEDLKRLKDEFEPSSPGDPRILTGSDWEGLIARLEAAERCAGYLGSLAVLDTTTEVLLKEWRKAAGK